MVVPFLFRIVPSRNAALPHKQLTLPLASLFLCSAQAPRLRTFVATVSPSGYDNDGAFVVRDPLFDDGDAVLDEDIYTSAHSLLEALKVPQPLV